MKRPARLLLLAIGAIGLGSLPVGAEERLSVRADRIETFQAGSDETRFGPLRFVGGLSLHARSENFGAYSGFRFRDGEGGRFVAVADTGFFFFGRIVRDRDGVPIGVADASLSPMTDENGEPQREKYLADAEGLSLDGDIASVSFEGRDEVIEYRLDGDRVSEPLRSVPILIPKAELRANGGLEALARSPEDSALAGARVVIAEESIVLDGHLFAAVLEGPRQGIFKVRKRGAFAVTDAAFLPDGRLLVLERSFTLLTGVGMQLRLIATDAIGPGRLVDGEVILTTGMESQIDNMEGLDVFRAEDGSLRVGIVSDDNRLILQRSLYLEFILDE